MTRDAFGWAVVGALALATFAALATAGRLPAVDLPQHALVLRRLVEPLPETAFAPLAPYTLFYLVAAPFLLVTDAVGAVRLAAALVVALLPVAAAALARARRASPALGAFAFLGAFSVVTAWGYVAVILGAAMLAAALAAAVAYARAPTRARGALLAAALIATYAAHYAAWLVALPAALLVTAARLPPPRLRALWPIAVAAAITVAAFAAWTAGHVVTQLERVNALFDVAGPGPLARLADLPQAASGFGPTGALLAPWATLAALFVLAAALGVARLFSARGAWLRRLALPAVAAACAAGYLVAPLSGAGVYLVYPRFLLFAIVVGVALVPRTRATTALALAAALPCLWLLASARAEAVAHDRATRCLDELAPRYRPGESLLALIWRAKPPGYDLPVDLHLAAELPARRGGRLDFEFADVGLPALGYREGYEREVPATMSDRPWNYHPAEDHEFTAWLLVAPPAPPEEIVGPGKRVDRCGDFALVTDETVAPGGRPATRFLPHRR